jgi:hypothetical protein
VRIGFRKVIKAVMPANNLPSAGVYSAQIKPAELRKLPLLAYRLCFVLDNVCLRHSGLKCPCTARRLWLFGSGYLGTL